MDFPDKSAAFIVFNCMKYKTLIAKKNIMALIDETLMPIRILIHR